MIFLTSQRLSPSIDLYIERCERLLADLKAIKAGTGPTEAELAAAPVMDQFKKAYAPIPCLVGQMQGHPRIPDGPGRTSDIWVMALDFGWVRTLSRYYRLGRALDEGGLTGSLPQDRGTAGSEPPHRSH